MAVPGPSEQRTGCVHAAHRATPSPTCTHRNGAPPDAGTACCLRRAGVLLRTELADSLHAAMLRL